MGPGRPRTGKANATDAREKGGKRKGCERAGAKRGTRGKQTQLTGKPWKQGKQPSKTRRKATEPQETREAKATNDATAATANDPM